MKEKAHFDQQGSTLVTSLMLLTLISLLGLATANTSQLNTRITHNALISSHINNELTNTISIASSKISSKPLTKKQYLDSSNTGLMFNPYNKDVWPESYALAGARETSEYIIEYLGCKFYLNTTLQNCEQNNNASPIHIYKITARVNIDNTIKYQQKILQLAYAPTHPRVKANNKEKSHEN